MSVAFAGEGAANQGSFHETLNLASLWKLPLIVIIEDNAWAISVSKVISTAIHDNSERAKAYGIPGVRVEENDVLAVYEVIGKAVERARAGDGPTLVEVRTFRYFGHFQGDPEMYRPKDEVNELKRKDPIEQYKKHLLEQGFVSETELNGLQRSAQKAVDEAIAFARESSYPEPLQALEDVFA